MTDLYRDFVFTRNTTPVGATDTAITVEDVSLFPPNNLLAKGEFYIAFESTLSYPPTFEICRLTNVNASTKTLTVVRGQAGTQAQSHAIVTYIKGTMTSDMLRRARAGLFGTSTPPPDADLFLVGDRFYHATEGRYYAFTGRAAFLVDTFTRTANATSMGATETPINVSTSAPWNQLIGLFGINATGQAYYASGAVSNVAVSAVNVGGTDFDTTFDVFASTTAASDYGIAFRNDVTASYGYYLGFLGTTATLWRINDSVLATTSKTVTFTTNTTHRWRIVANGDTIQVYKDGTLAFTLTESTTGYTQASYPYLPGAYIGMRINSAAATTDTALFWDNFTCTYPGNTANNTPALQGWAAASAPLNDNIKSVETTIATLVSQVDDVAGAVVFPESASISLERVVPRLLSRTEDLREIVVDLDTRGENANVILAQTAVQVDNLLELILNDNTLLGVGDPYSLNMLPGVLYVDTVNKRLWVNSGSSWLPLTYAGPSTNVPAPLTEHLPATTSTIINGISLGIVPTLAWPTGTSVGDLAVLFWAGNESSLTALVPPAGWNIERQGMSASGYYSAYVVATKMVTAVDLSTNLTLTASWYADNAVLRTFAGAAVDVSAASTVTTNTTTVTAPSVTTTKTNDVVISMFMNLGSTVTLTSGPALSNVTTTNTSINNNVVWTGYEVVAAAGATTARTITAAGTNTVQAGVTLALKAVPWTPVQSPGALTGVGAPTITPTPPTGSLYVDTATNIVYYYTGSAWTALVNDPQPAWQAPTLLNNWTNYNTATYQPAGYFLNSTGDVHLRGVVTNAPLAPGGVAAAGTSVIFTLPVGYRPEKAIMNIAQSNNGTGYVSARVDVLTDGTVQITDQGGYSFLSLDQISFKQYQ